MQTTPNAITTILRELGIDDLYGIDPFRPIYPEAEDLVDVEPNIIGRMQRLTTKTAADWHAMKTAAGVDRVELLLVSGFRSIAYQAEVVRSKLARGSSIEAVLAVTAAPGFSQHHSGQTVDIATPGAPPLTESFASTDAFAWLSSHAAGFGFRMPYDRDNAFGFAYEPWHWTQLGEACEPPGPNV